MNKHYISSIKELLKEKRNILIVSHSNPDGDAIGSSLALYNYFLLKKQSVNVIVPNQFPEFLAWMKGSEKILTYNTQKKLCEELINNAEIIFFLDFNSLKRLEKLQDVVRNAKSIKVLIDHHLQPELESFDFAFSEVKVSSTSELIYDFISALGDEKLINADVASCLYVGIMTDTGSYSYSCNYEKTYKITASIIKTGVDAEEIHHLVYDTFSENRLRLLGYCLSERLTVIAERSTAYIALSKAELKRFNYQVGDTEGVVNYALSINKINLAALFTERDGAVRISFRSKGEVDVNVFARTYFEGGGHMHASGATSYLSLADTIKKFEQSINDFAEVLNKE
ncbi:MAG: bifunctional oligoribonuclease/PAP phosphatase NrnA [Bacteroidetes bacterium]|nr:bifunctional oligoribonuclease/PAP phosphatase NrnA [Bacteroidota bacterium]